MDQDLLGFQQSLHDYHAATIATQIHARCNCAVCLTVEYEVTLLLRLESTSEVCLGPNKVATITELVLLKG